MIVGAYISRDAGGWFVEWCDTNRRGDMRVQRWYGSRQDVEDRAQLPPDRTGWHRVDHEMDAPPYDAATATGMYDGW